MWNPVGRNPTWHLSPTFNKKHWQRNFTLRAWVNFISPRKAVLALQPVRAVKIREQADAWLVCKCNMTITCSEHFKMQRSSLQQRKKKGDRAYFLQFSISFQPPKYFCKLFSVSACIETAQTRFSNQLHHGSFPCNGATIVTVVTVKSCGEHLRDWKKKRKEEQAGASQPPGSELKHLITVQLLNNREWWRGTSLRWKSKWIHSLKNTIVPSQSGSLLCRLLYLFIR